MYFQFPDKERLDFSPDEEAFSSSLKIQEEFRSFKEIFDSEFDFVLPIPLNTGISLEDLKVYRSSYRKDLKEFDLDIHMKFFRIASFLEDENYLTFLSQKICVRFQMSQVKKFFSSSQENEKLKKELREEFYSFVIETHNIPSDLQLDQFFTLKWFIRAHGFNFFHELSLNSIHPYRRVAERFRDQGLKYFDLPPMVQENRELKRYWKSLVEWKDVEISLDFIKQPKHSDNDISSMLEELPDFLTVRAKRNEFFFGERSRENDPLSSCLEFKAEYRDEGRDLSLIIERKNTHNLVICSDINIRVSKGSIFFERYLFSGLEFNSYLNKEGETFTSGSFRENGAIFDFESPELLPVSFILSPNERKKHQFKATPKSYRFF